eukprot:gnl/TRDRNA2_/TRDRNA2_189584_c0_seq1.p1 gnl/TRDRNA2_/TRDRNA2_189584_c0~~gnl/TRDRNA2_/TRDRNA2_189584_c0_seq1.p1  ORF type:complete len:328 (+),score=40.31 gnl/TRDRNA2_/TRDRNA2_189584_c0_seq1:89-1072(+)
MLSLHVLIVAVLGLNSDALQSCTSRDEMIDQLGLDSDEFQKVRKQNNKAIDHQVLSLPAGVFELSLLQHTWGMYADMTEDRINISGITKRSAFPVYIESTNTSTGKTRRDALKQQCFDQGLHCMILPFPPGRDKEADLNGMTISMVKMFMDSPHEAAILTQDDVKFIPNLIEEMRQTLEDVPNQDDNMDLMHLCPGALWGRERPTPDNHFSMRPDWQVVNDKPSANGRTFLEWPKLTQGACCSLDIGVVPGAPVAVLMTKQGAAQTLRKFKEVNGMTGDEQLSRISRLAMMAFDDVHFRDLGLEHKGRHWMAREPQLCKEIGGYRET